MTALSTSQEERQSSLSTVQYVRLQLPARPRLAPWLTVVDLGDHRLQLRSAESAHTLAHPLLVDAFRRIETKIDGRHSVIEIAAVAGPDILPTTVIFLLKMLQGKGLLQPGFGDSPLDAKERGRWQRQLTFLSHFVSDADGAQSVLAKARIGVVGSAELRAAISASLASVGVGDLVDLGEAAFGAEHADQSSRLDLIIACKEAPGFDFFDRINRACLQSRVRWLRVCVAGASAQLGPTVVPHETACYTCLDLRQRAHEPDIDGYLAYRSQSGAPGHHVDTTSAAPLVSIVAGQVALEAMRLLTGFAPAVTVGRFYEIGAASQAATAHDVLKVPGCPSCGRRRAISEAWDRSFAAVGLAP
jgi:bacteriocin biosynthesis cyclodehydratase domain-containing protein